MRFINFIFISEPRDKMEGITIVKRPVSETKCEPVKKKQCMVRPKLITHVGTVLQGTYSIPKTILPKKWKESEWFKSLKVVPKVAPINGQKPEPFLMCEEKEDTLELPKFLGLIWLGPPETDTRTLGPLVPFSFTGSLTSTKQRPQQLAHDRCVTQLCDTGGALLVLPCGFGKTVVSLAIAASLKRKTLIIVTSVELAHQWSERIQQFLGCQVGWIQGDTFETEPSIVIAMLQTLVRRQPDLTLFGTCIVDEAHHVAARSFSQVMPLVSCRYILGLSATPNRKDGLKKVLHWTLGLTAFEAKRTHDPEGVPNVMRCKVTEGRRTVITYKSGDVGRSKMITLLTADRSRNDFIVHMLGMVLRKNGGRKILMLSDRREQVSCLESMITCVYTGVYTCGTLLGGMKKEDIEKSKEAQVLLSTYHYCSEGFDLPRLDTLFLLSPRTDVEQSVGRVLRQHPEKQRPLILDFVDNFSVFDSQGDKREQYFKKLRCNIQTFDQLHLLQK